MCESVPPNAGDDDDDGWAIVEETAVATGDRGTATAVATSAKTYSTVLAIAATDVLEAAWHAMGGQKAHWPLRINLLYPFVEASEFATTAVTLRDALRGCPPLCLRLARHVTIVKHGKLWAVQLAVDSLVDMLELLQRTCEDAVPGSSAAGFAPHVMLGAFSTEAEARAAIEEAGWAGGELTVNAVTMMSRADAAQPFQPAITVGLGDSGTVEYETAEPQRMPAFGGLTLAEDGGAAAAAPASATYQRGRDGSVRLSFELAATPSKTQSSMSKGGCKMLFVLDQSYSMIGAENFFFGAIFNAETNNLPRQARDKHRKS